MAPAAKLRVLFLCTHNSARSQIAEALLARKGRDRFSVASAGAQPAQRVHPAAVDVLREHGIDWTNHTPKALDQVTHDEWDLIITLCDRARETCPTFPGQPVFAHWSMEDPAEVPTENDLQRKAFHETVAYLSRRIDLMMALPVERLERQALETRVRRIGSETMPTPSE
jgi:arsenate reductase